MNEDANRERFILVGGLDTRIKLAASGETVEGRADIRTPFRIDRGVFVGGPDALMMSR